MITKRDIQSSVMSARAKIDERMTEYMARYEAPSSKTELLIAWRKMPLAKRLQLQKQSPELFNALSAIESGIGGSNAITD